MTQSILRSEWPEPNSSQTQAAFGFHLENYTQWLNSAGAQNRLALGFFDSETGLSRSLEYFRNADVEPVVVESSRDEPVPALVSRHRGTHFNRKLFSGFRCHRIEWSIESRVPLFWNQLTKFCPRRVDNFLSVWVGAWIVCVDIFSI